MKKIAITQRLVEVPAYGEIRDCLDLRWSNLLGELSVLPIILPTNYTSIEYINHIGIDGIILSGGNDLSSLANNNLSQKRDEFEKKLIEVAMELEIGIYAVCRGMQVIAEFFGGNFKRVKGHVVNNHYIIPNAESEYYNELSQIDKVNSFHNYSIDKLPEGFICSAKSDDGGLEAMESKNYNIWAQMWHPEREKEFQLADKLILRKVFRL